MSKRESFYLHAFARGVEKRTIFIDDTDHIRFLLALTLSLRPKAPSMSTFLNLVSKHLISPGEFRKTTLNKSYGKPTVNILSAVLMSNHFHLHLKFSSPNECSKVLQRLLNSYTKYFNTRHGREGRLFSSKIQKVAIVTDEQNLYLTKYIHTNPATSSRTRVKLENLDRYSWSTYKQYLGNPHRFTLKEGFTFDTTYFCDPKPILKQFSNLSFYKAFILSPDELSLPLKRKMLIDQSK